MRQHTAKEVSKREHLDLFLRGPMKWVNQRMNSMDDDDFAAMVEATDFDDLSTVTNLRGSQIDEGETERSERYHRQ